MEEVIQKVIQDEPDLLDYTAIEDIIYKVGQEELELPDYPVMEDLIKKVSQDDVATSQPSQVGRHPVSHLGGA